MKFILETENEDEIHLILNAGKIKAEVLNLHQGLRTYMKHADRTPESDAKQLELLYSDLSTLAYED
jgi:hypothetical protein